MASASVRSGTRPLTSVGSGMTPGTGDWTSSGTEPRGMRTSLSASLDRLAASWAALVESGSLKLRTKQSVEAAGRCCRRVPREGHRKDCE
jgi:hypothetical protein